MLAAALLDWGIWSAKKGGGRLGPNIQCVRRYTSCLMFKPKQALKSCSSEIVSWQIVVIIEFCFLQFNSSTLIVADCLTCGRNILLNQRGKSLPEVLVWSDLGELLVPCSSIRSGFGPCSRLTCPSYLGEAAGSELQQDVLVAIMGFIHGVEAGLISFWGLLIKHFPNKVRNCLWP